MANAMELELARLRLENEQLKAKAALRSTVSFHVSEKGALSMYGHGRFPVTLYCEAWESVLNHADMIRAKIKENAGALVRKADDEATKATKLATAKVIVEQRQAATAARK